MGGGWCVFLGGGAQALLRLQWAFCFLAASATAIATFLHSGKRQIECQTSLSFIFFSDNFSLSFCPRPFVLTRAWNAARWQRRDACMMPCVSLQTAGGHVQSTIPHQEKQKHVYRTANRTLFSQLQVFWQRLGQCWHTTALTLHWNTVGAPWQWAMKSWVNLSGWRCV